MEISKPLDKALNFNQENFFEYMDVLLHNMNTEIIGSQSMKTTKKLYKYIRSLHLADTENPFIPNINGSTRCCIRSLCIDQKLFPERILI